MNVNRILFPTDFSEHSKVAERTACDYAAHFGAELHVLHVLNDLCLMMPDAAAELLIPPKVLEDLIVSAEEEIEKVPLATGTCNKVVRVVRIGSTYASIVQYAKDNAIDLIVIGTHGRTGLPHVLLGSIAERVVQHAQCPVLTVRSDQLVAVDEKKSIGFQPELKPV